MTQNTHETPKQKAQQLLTLLNLNGLEPEQELKVYELISSGADLTVTETPGGDPALVRAAKMAYNDVVKFMVEHGCDVNIRGENGSTALFYVFITGHIDLVQSLLDAGADVDAKDNIGRAPADYARQFMGSETAKLLIKVSDEKRALKTYIESGAPAPNTLRVRKMLPPTQKNKP